MLAKELDEQRSRINLGRDLPAVHRHRDLNHSQILLNQDFVFGGETAVAVAAGRGGATPAWAEGCTVPADARMETKAPHPL